MALIFEKKTNTEKKLKFITRLVIHSRVVFENTFVVIHNAHDKNYVQSTVVLLKRCHRGCFIYT